MTNELRGVALDEIRQMELYEGEIISVGSEGCVHDCIRKIVQLLNMGKKEFISEISFRIVTPRIPEKYVATMLKLLAEVAASIRINSIVINDYGLLYCLHKKHLLYGDIILGRTLIRTLADVPWYNLFVEPEKVELRESMLQSNIMHLEKMALFKEYNVTGVELSPVQVNENIMVQLRKNGFRCYVHYDNEIATVGRTCPHLRIKKSKAQNCIINCDEPVWLKFVKPYGLTKLDSNIAKIYPDLCNINNVIYHRQNVSEGFAYQNSDGVIFDYRLSDAEKIDRERRKLLIS